MNTSTAWPHQAAAGAVLRRGRRWVLGGVVAGLGLALSACATAPSRVLSPGPVYTGEAPVARLSVYVFMDARPAYIHPEFRRQFERGLASALDAAGVPSRQTWFLDTSEGQKLRGDWKNHTLGEVTFVSVGQTVAENTVADAEFNPSHLLIAFPRDTYRVGNGAVLDVKWDVIDARNGNVEWSVYTRTPVLSGQMTPEEAAQAAQGLLQTIIQELRARAVLRR